MSDTAISGVWSVLAPFRDLFCDSNPFHLTVNDASIKKANVPDSPRLEDVTVLPTLSFQASSPFVMACVFARGL